MTKGQQALRPAAKTSPLADKEADAKRKVQAGIHLDRMKLDRQLKRKRTETDQKVGLAEFYPFCSTKWSCVVPSILTEKARHQIVMLCAVNFAAASNELQNATDYALSETHARTMQFHCFA